MLIDRPYLKGRAKDVLRRCYWMSVLASLIVGILGGGGSSCSSSSYSLNTDSFQSLTGSNGEPPMSGDTAAALIAVIVLIGAIGLAAVVFLGNIMTVGSSRYYSSCRYGVVELKNVFYGFPEGRYLNCVKAMGLVTLYVTLWSLLLIIPGIIAAYRYWMVPWILAENPHISPHRALEISDRTTAGDKMDMFLLSLSFIGWQLLVVLAAALTCGVGSLGSQFLNPYIQATYAELYGALRQKAVQSGYASQDEIGADVAL